MHSEGFYSLYMECDTQNGVADIESIYTMNQSFESKKNKTHPSSLTVRLLGLGDILSRSELALPTLNGYRNRFSFLFSSIYVHPMVFPHCFAQRERESKTIFGIYVHLVRIYIQE